MTDSITLKLKGTPIPNPALPGIFSASSRGAAAAAANPFLPDGYLKLKDAFDVSQRARSSTAGAVESASRAEDNDVVVLEMADGVTVITSAKKLRESLARVQPAGVELDGALNLEALHERAGATRGVIGDAVTDLVARVYTVTVGEVADPIIEAARRKLAEWSAGRTAGIAELGVTWLGTKALMWAIESRLDQKPGICRWPRGMGQAVDLLNVAPEELARDAQEGPLLVFLHGMASSTIGSFGDLQNNTSDDWQALETKFGERIYGFEHRTLSQSPIENAIELASALPKGAQINLVTHSRGGLVGDLLCLQNFNEALIESFKNEFPEPGDVSADERLRIQAETDAAHAEHRAQLRELRTLLHAKQLVIQRYVRVGCPARGTLLASGNFDIFLSALLTLIGRVPYLYGNPLYYAFKRVVLEIAKNRTNARLVPGVEAMLPDAPMARFLALAEPQASTQLAVIAGDIEGGGLLKRLGVLFTDYAFFCGVDNDLAVDTDSMYAGIAQQAKARAYFDQGPTTGHFNYFLNQQTRAALRDWLVTDDVEQIDVFTTLAGDLRADGSTPEEARRLMIPRRRRDGAGSDANLPVAVMLPGIMGSYLWRGGKDRVWFDLPDLITGGLEKLKWSERTGSVAGDGIMAEKLYDDTYGDLCDYLAATHRVERFPYDWRLPLDELADTFEPILRKLLDDTKLAQRPIRILAHSMGGLVVRALIHKYPALWDELMVRDGARFIMLGTPNQGAHSMVETLIGAGDTVRQLARADVRHNLQEILDIIAGFRGALQLLPRPGFHDVGGAQFDDYFTDEPWIELKAAMKDFWFGDQVAAIPEGAALRQGKWLWAPATGSTAALPPAHKEKTIYVHGCAPNTACGIKKEGARWKMLGTDRGDGTVTWASGWIDGIGGRYFMPAIHGDLASTTEHFSALHELLVNGTTAALTTSEPQTRGAKEPIIAYTPNPPTYGTATELAHALMGAPKRQRRRTGARPALSVTVRAMDLRFVSQPILVGHYEQDAISGAEAVIDSEVVSHALSERYNLGLYAGALGTAVVVLRLPNAAEKLRGSCSGAVVTGLGPYDGMLATNTLTEAVRTGALRYLLQYADCSGERSGEVALCSLLLGYNSTANLTIAAAVEALLRGVVEANKKFAEATRGSLRIRSLEIIELYRDTAISAMRSLQGFAAKNNVETNGLGVFLEVPEELQEGRGARQRLDDSRSAAYYPRLIITNADRDQDEDTIGDANFRRAARAAGAVQAAVSSGPTAAIAARLRFVHVGQRARAETVVQQRQPGLVESLVAQQIQVKTYRPDFCRTLFQLMVPHEFKEAARQLDCIVLVVDGYTANLPWELMLADQEPLAVRASVIRQLASSKFRRQVRQTLAPLAYVIGNPSTANFFTTFPVPGAKPSDALEPLDGAEREAEIVVETLRRHGYAVEQAIGQERKALDVTTALYQKSYRIVHIAAHGMFEQRAVDGSARSGVVLSDGLLLGAAEIGQMEIVPDLVFLNCCHLAKIDPRPVAYNRLAYSVARELIEIGVRCVVAAGWAVDDDAADTFAETFYQGILQENLQFGDAVFAARRETYRKHGGSITWGAYQAYGDPGWRVNPGGASSSFAKSAQRFVAPEELLDGIAAVRMKISRHRDALSKPYARNLAGELETLMDRSPKNWAAKPAVKYAKAAAYAELGADYFERACELYNAAILAEDRAGQVPIAAIEQLANLEARLGDHKSLPALIDRAVQRLRELDKVVATTVDYHSGEKSAVLRNATNPERASMLGSVYKRKAAICARKIVAGDGSAATRREFNAALKASIAAYQTAAGKCDTEIFEPYPALNWLALKSIGGRFTVGVNICRQCAKIANGKFARTPEFWCAVMAPEAALVESLCDGSLGGSGAAAQHRLDQIARGYADALATIQVAPKELDSMAQQLGMLALFFEAKRKSRVSQQLRRLAERLLSGSSGAGEDRAAVAPARVSARNSRKRGPRKKA